MEKFTLQIFGFGETHITSKDLNFRIESKELNKVEPLIDSVWSKKPEETEGNKEDFVVIHFFDFRKISWIGKKTNQGFLLNADDDDIPTELINDLISELESLK